MPILACKSAYFAMQNRHFWNAKRVFLKKDSIAYKTEKELNCTLKDIVIQINKEVKEDSNKQCEMKKQLYW